MEQATQSIHTHAEKWAKHKKPQHLKELLLQIKQSSQLLQHEIPLCKNTDPKHTLKLLPRTRNTNPDLYKPFQGVAVSMANSKPLGDNIYQLSWWKLASLYQICLYFPQGRALLSFERRHLFTSAEIKSLPRRASSWEAEVSPAVFD